MKFLVKGLLFLRTIDLIWFKKFKDIFRFTFCSGIPKTAGRRSVEAFAETTS